MKKDKAFRDAVMYSTYLNPHGTETLVAVNNRYGQPFKMPTLYKHMLRHQTADIAVSEAMTEAKGIKSPNWQRKTTRTLGVQEAVENTVKIVEGDKKEIAQVERALNAFIKAGEALVDTGNMPISAANYIAAIKVKADIEMRTKDRKLEALKAMFSGAAPASAEEK